MASSDLIIDDSFCGAMGTYFLRQGKSFDQMVTEYVNILQKVRSNAIINGEVADALTTFIEYARQLNGQVGNLSAVANEQVKGFISAVDAADQYLF